MTLKEIKNYSVRQNNWIKANNMKLGNQVLVLREHKKHSKGWDNVFVSSMREKIGKTLSFVQSSTQTGISLSDCFLYPYTVLVKVPKGKYETRVFYWKNNEYKCIVHKTLKASKIGEFGFQENGGNGTPILRKISNEISADLLLNSDNMYKIARKKGFYPLSFSNNYDDLNLVVASELTGIGLPILKYPK